MALAIACLGLLCLGVYIPALGHQFLILDDSLYVTENPYVLSGLNLVSIHWALVTHVDPYYMPVTRLSYLLDATLFGINPVAFHGVNIAIHFINCVLLLQLVRRLGGSVTMAFAAAAVFAVHPQHVEAVAWVAQRKELLSGMFGLAALNFYSIQYRMEPAAGNLHARLPGMLGLLCALLSYLAKPTWITLPLLLLLLEYWPLGTLNRQNLSAAIRDKLPLILITAGVVLLHLTSEAMGGQGHVVSPLREIPFLQRLGNTFLVYDLYCLQTLIPLGTSVYYPYPGEPLEWWLLVPGMVMFAAISWLTWTRRVRQPFVLFGWLWFATALFPVLGLLGTGEAILLGDRWTYLPHIGLFIAMAYMLSGDHGGGKVYLRLAPLVLVCLLLLAISRTVVGAWHDDRTYWTRSLAHTVYNHMAEVSLGTWYLLHGRLASAEPHLRVAVALKPTEPYYILQYGNLLLKSGHRQQAFAYYDKLLATAPLPLVYQVGKVMILNREFSTARRFLLRVLELPVVDRWQAGLQRLAMIDFAVLQSLAGDSDSRIRKLFSRLLTGSVVDRAAACSRFMQEIRQLSRHVNTERPEALLRDACVAGRGSTTGGLPAGAD